MDYSGTPRKGRLEGYENYPGAALFAGQLEGTGKSPSRGPMTPVGRQSFVVGSDPQSASVTRFGTPLSSSAAGRSFQSPMLHTQQAPLHESDLPAVSVLDGLNPSRLDDTNTINISNNNNTSFFPQHQQQQLLDMSMARSSLVPSQATSLSADDTWVTVFGFPSSHTTAVIEEFLSCGQIVSHHTDSPHANWVHVRFETGVGAQRAVARDGQLLERLGLMVGVRRYNPSSSSSSVSSSSSIAPSSLRKNTSINPNASLFLREQRATYSVSAAHTPYAGAPYPVNGWWSKILFYFFGL